MNALTPLIIITATLLATILFKITISILKKYAEKTTNTVDDAVLDSIERPLKILILVSGFYYAIHKTPVLVDFINSYDADLKYRLFILTIFGTWMVATFVKRMIKDYGHKLQEENLLEESHLNFANIVVSYFVWIIGIAIAISAMGLQITPILAGMGVFGLVIALATQTLVSNIFGGILITTDKLYTVGDRVEIDGIHGDVIEIKARYTKIKTIHNTIVTVPNSTVITSKIINYSEPSDIVMLKIPVSCNYGADVIKVKQVIESVIPHVKGVLHTDPYTKMPLSNMVYFTEFGASSLNFETRLWVERWDERYPVTDAFYSLLYKTFQEEGIEIPFNQMDVHIKSAHKE